MQCKHIGLFRRTLISGGECDTNGARRSGCLFLHVQTKAKHNVNIKAEQEGYIHPETKKPQAIKPSTNHTANPVL